VLIYVTACSYLQDVNFPRKDFSVIDLLINVTSYKRCILVIFVCHRSKFFLGRDFIDRFK